MGLEVRHRSLFLKVGQFILDSFEIYIPSITFSIMFLAFIINIFFRYFLDNPLTWPYEVTIYGFIWTAILGACYARRMNEHVVFGLIYDKLKPKGQLLLRLSSNTVVASGFIVAFVPTYNYIQFMSFQKSTVLKIPFNVVFFPYVIFSLIIIGRSVYDIVLDMKKIIRGEI